MAIVDLQMPDMDGLVTITKLKEIKPGIKNRPAHRAWQR
jgi:CheY-like chemotaxis protein